MPMECYVAVDIIMVNKGISYHPWLLVGDRKEDEVSPLVLLSNCDLTFRFLPSVVENTWRFVPKRS
jgi:hypothetical protein